MNQSDWIQHLVREHEAPLCRYALSLCGDLATARDAVQETFLRLCRAERSRLEGHEAAWLFRVCRSRVLDMHRKAKPMQTLSPQHESKLADPARPPDEVALHRDSAAQLPALLDKLPGRQREALRLKFQDGLSYRDIARVMRVSESNVGFLLHTAIKTLGVHMKHLQGALS